VLTGHDTEARLRALLHHLREEVPFYGELLAGADCERHAVTAFAGLPSVSKQTVRREPLRFVARALTRRGADRERLAALLGGAAACDNETPVDLSSGDTLFVEKTSGSTGIPLKMLKSLSERLVAGKGAWKQRRRLDSVSNVRDILEEVGRRGYVWLHGHPQGLAWWAEIILENPGLRRLARFRYVESNGSKLFAEARALMEEAFGCPVVDNYNCREVWTVAYECGRRRLHVNDELIVAELAADDGTPIREPGRPGRLLVTSLFSRAMPFVRYELGDRAEYAAGTCDCGSAAPVISVVPGRPHEVIAGHGEEFGSDVFSKVTRFLYGSFDFQYAGVRVVQNSPEDFDVYVADFSGDRADFRERFARVTEALLPTRALDLRMSFVGADHPLFAAHPYDLFINRCGTLAAPPDAVPPEPARRAELLP
jgi:phenylacetate-CoA ligase